MVTTDDFFKAIVKKIESKILSEEAEALATDNPFQHHTSVAKALDKIITEIGMDAYRTIVK